MGTFKTIILGGDGGSPFDPTTISQFKIRGGARVDAIFLNGTQHGGDGGSMCPTVLELQKNNEYINHAVIRHGSRVDNIIFTTNLGNSAGAGGGGGDETVLSNIRLVSIGGRSGSELDQIQITYVDGYNNSDLFDAHAEFIIGYVAPNTTMVNYESTVDVTTSSYEQVTSQMTSTSFSASVEAEYGAKVSASTSLNFTDSTTTTIANSLSQTLETKKKTTQTVGDDEVGIMVVEGTIMKGADGTSWMYPNYGSNFAIIKKSDWRNLLNHYDLTGTLDTQIGELEPHKTIKNGYVFYQKG